MKKSVVLVVIVLLILAGVYLSKNQIKSRIGISAAPSQAPTVAEKMPVPTPSDAIYFIKTDSTKAQRLTDGKGRTLYIFRKDTSGVSNCTGTCLTNWPIYAFSETRTKSLPANISVITRPDGSKQYAWKGMPLYYFAGDTQPRDIKGEIFSSAWHTVKP